MKPTKKHIKIISDRALVQILAKKQNVKNAFFFFSAAVSLIISGTELWNKGLLKALCESMKMSNISKTDSLDKEESFKTN